MAIRYAWYLGMRDKQGSSLALLTDPVTIAQQKGNLEKGLEAPPQPTIKRAC